MFGVLVRKKYAATLNHRVSLGVVSYSEWVGRSPRNGTRLTVHPRSTTLAVAPYTRAAIMASATNRPKVFSRMPRRRTSSS
jgi:hypothetical protein